MSAVICFCSLSCIVKNLISLQPHLLTASREGKNELYVYCWFEMEDIPIYRVLLRTPEKIKNKE